MDVFDDLHTRCFIFLFRSAIHSLHYAPTLTEGKIHRCRCDTRCAGSPNKVQG
jgi:hypothetical protein